MSQITLQLQEPTRHRRTVDWSWMAILAGLGAFWLAVVVLLVEAVTG